MKEKCKHEPDPKSAQPADGCAWVIDFNCVHCGRGGSVEVDPKKIDFDVENE